MKPFYDVISTTPVMAHAGLYSAGDQVGLVNTITGACADDKGQARLHSITIIDKAKQDKVMDVWIFNQSPTLDNVDNGAFSLADSEAAKCLGFVRIPAANYSDSALNSVATVSDIDMVLEGYAGKRDLYCVLQTRDTPTYANGDLILLFGLEQV